MGRANSLLGSLFLLVFSVSVYCQDNDNKRLEEQIRIEIENLNVFNNSLSEGEKIHADIVLPKFYIDRNYRPAWQNPEITDRFCTILEQAGSEGLSPDDYHISVINKKRALLSGQISTAVQSELDILLTDAFLTYTSHILHGKVNPVSMHPEWNVVRREEDPIELLEEYLKTGNITTWREKILPESEIYGKLKDALERYRQIELNHGWSEIAQGDLLEIGSLGDRVLLLRQRLTISGDLSVKQNENSAIFDEELAGAVRKYQLRHGLEVDGRAGKETLAELNIPVEDRIKQIIVNLERTRWLPLHLGSQYLLVNIANFELSIIQNNSVQFTSHVIVGKPYRKTPVFSASMSYLVFNPTWTVPPTILKQDILPQVKKDPGYLAQRNIRILDHQEREIDPYQIDWSTISGKEFPYIMRQDPGPNNTLGDVKFMFPNPYHIYIHDTPNKELFGKPYRHFSSGCIRVSRPLELAEFLLNDSQNWNIEKINKLIDSRKTSSIFLKQKLPVYLMYWTSWVDQEGSIHFRKDIYERDGVLYNALLKSE